MPARHAAAGPRRLLARLRDVMAGAGSGQERLNKLVSLIATELVAEVCSVYVLRTGEVLELFATHGLNPDAVHRTRLRVDEGLVGKIAAHQRPLAIFDAQAHPDFAYRPETGEEIFHSLMGVPVQRGGRVLGVLAVQNRKQRHYTEEEVETLQTVAMVLAELVAGGDLLSHAEMMPADGIAMLPLRLDGIRLAGGIGMGGAVLHQPRYNIRALVADDTDQELARLESAVAEMHGALDDMLEDTAGEHRDILETYRMIAEDRGWLSRIREAVSGGLTAEGAVQKVQNDTRQRMAQVTDPYIRERMHDLDDLAGRLFHHLGSRISPTADLDANQDIVVFARTLGPADLLDYTNLRLRGLVLEEGSQGSHVAIVARGMDIPVVGRVSDAMTKVEPGDPVIIDGDHSQVFVRPGEDVLSAFYESLKARSERKAIYAALRDEPAQTLDGDRVSLMANAGLLADLNQLDDVGADGIGLYRTEVPFMARPEFPDVPSQTQLYAKVLEMAGSRPVVFRTLDVGGDKVLPYWNASDEENPAMGWRAVRLSLDRPSVLRHQLRALVRAHAGREMRVMFPMIAEVAELNRARAILDMELDREAAGEGRMPSSVKVGAMVEVPALAFQLPALLSRVDFLSVGSNDLLQFLFAADRGNPRVAERYDTLSPPVLSFLRFMQRSCRDAGVTISLCGEMAGRTLDAMVLIGLGFDVLSMTTSSIGPVKAMVRSLDRQALAAYLDSLCDQSDHSLREKLRSYAQDHGVMI